MKKSPIVIFLALVVASSILIGIFQFPKSRTVQEHQETAPITQRTGSTSPSDISFVQIHAKNPQYTYPQIRGYANTAVQDHANALLEETYQDLGCNDVKEDPEHTWDVILEVVYSMHDIFSVIKSGSYDCGGAYPTNDMSETLTYDLRADKAVNFTQLFSDYERDQEMIIGILFAKEITKTNIYLDAHPSDKTEDCDSVNTLDSLSQFPLEYTLSSTTKNITVRTDYPHVIEACNVSAEVPISILLPFTSTSSLLRRITE